MQVSYAIGVAQPLSVHVDTYGTGTIPDKDILDAVLKNFDFRPGASIPSVRPFSFLISLPAVSFRKCCSKRDATSLCGTSGSVPALHGKQLLHIATQANPGKFFSSLYMEVCVCACCRHDCPQPGPEPRTLQEDRCIWPLWP